MSQDLAHPRPTVSDRLQDLGWTVATSVISTLLAAGCLYAVGEVTGVNDRIFDGSCSTFESLYAEEKQRVLEDATAREHLDRDRDGDLCESG
jgi:hypothetical protein